MAGTALPRTVGGQVEILSGQGMPAFAVSLSSVGGRHRLSPKNVLPCCHGFKVVWVHTFAVAAQVINDEALWDWSDEAFVGPAMRAPSVFTNREARVTV